MIIQHAVVEKGDVIISIGFIRTGAVSTLLNCRPKYVEAYDPNISVYRKYLTFSDDSNGIFVPVQKAVSGKLGTAILKGKSYGSTICAHPKSKMRIQQEVIVVSMSSVIERVYNMFGQIDRLLLNCEGSEVSIIKETSIEIIKLCRYIFVQFHDFIPELRVSKEDKKDCLDLLQPFYNRRLVCAGRSEYEFTRNGNDTT